MMKVLRECVNIVWIRISLQSTIIFIFLRFSHGKRVNNSTKEASFRSQHEHPSRRSIFSFPFRRFSERRHCGLGYGAAGIHHTFNMESIACITRLHSLFSSSFSHFTWRTVLDCGVGEWKLSIFARSPFETGKWRCFRLFFFGSASKLFCCFSCFLKGFLLSPKGNFTRRCVNAESIKSLIISCKLPMCVDVEEAMLFKPRKQINLIKQTRRTHDNKQSLSIILRPETVRNAATINDRLVFPTGSSRSLSMMTKSSNDKQPETLIAP